MHDQASLDKVARLTHYLSLDPGNANLCVDIGDELIRQGRSEQAAEYFERGADLGHDVARSRIAGIRLMQRRFADALDLLNDLLSHEHGNGVLHFNAGVAQFHLHAYREAIVHFAQALRSGTSPGECEKYLTYCYHYCGEVQEAVQHCEAWRAQGGGSAAQAYMGILCFDGGDRSAARVAAIDALADNPVELEAHAVIGALALEEQRFDEAEQAFAHALSINPDHGRSLLGKGLGLLHDQDFSVAIETLRRAVAQMEGHAGTVVTLGWAYLLGGLAGEAEATFVRAIELDRNFAEAHGGLAAVCATMGRTADAKQHITVADRLDPRNFGAVYARVLLLRAEGRIASANELMRRALDTPPVPGAPPLLASLKGLLIK